METDGVTVDLGGDDVAVVVSIDLPVGGFDLAVTIRISRRRSLLPGKTGGFRDVESVVVLVKNIDDRVEKCV